MAGVTRSKPQDCMPGDRTLASQVAHWRVMSGKEAVAFQKWTGIKNYNGYLVRDGKWIFAVSPDAQLAKCVYAHDRSFT